MKKTYKKLMALTGAFGLFAFAATAQISGVVTVNSAAATGGTNYQTFSDLALALNTSGVNGPLTVNVVTGSGPYVEQPLFMAIAGTSSSNRIVINGNGNWITFTSNTSATPYTMGFNGTDWVTVNNLNLYAGGTTWGIAMSMTGGADNNTFSACTFSCLQNGTSSSQIPFNLGANLNFATSGSNSGNNNSITSCTMANGYYGIWCMGRTGTPYQENNRFTRNVIMDYYVYGTLLSYHVNPYFGYNTIERPNRATSTFIYGLNAYYNQGAMYEGNIIQRNYGTQANGTSSFYGFYCYQSPVSGGIPNTMRNNILTDVNTTGFIYGAYTYYFSGDIYNNTFNLDANVNNNSTMYGMYTYGGNGWPVSLRNNLFTIRKPGTGTRYGIYVALNGNSTFDRNNVVMTPTTVVATSYYGYYSGNQAGVTNWVAAGVDANAMSIDPMYTNTVTNDYMPTNVAMNDLGGAITGLVFDQRSAVRNPTTPDVGAIEFLSPSCSGVPGLNSVTAPSFAICPGENVNMTIASLTASTGLTYQWSASNVSNVGPFTPIVGATGLALAANQVTANTWYQVVQTCTVPGGGSASFVGTVTVAGPTSSMVPAYEGFEGIGLPNRLPNCSWTATGLGGQNKTYTSSNSGNRVPRTGTSFGAFDNGSTGTSAYYTNDIAMNAGITYSAAVWYATEYFGYNNWSNLQILVGPNQSAVNATVVASVASAISGPYALLNGLFTVPSSGNYYVGIRATSASGSAQYLMIDDLSITIPCTANSGNTPTLSASASAQTVCAGTQIALNATGADTYTWSMGQNGASVNDAPMTPGLMNYSVVGTNTMTGCDATVIIPVQVDPTPNVFAVANPPVVCAGSPVIISAYGANSYAWSNSSIGQVITVNPTTAGTTNYTVIGTNSQGCTGTFVQAINVNALPNVVVNSSNPGSACKDDMLTLTANNGVTYQWYSSTNSSILQGNPVNVQASSTTIFTVMATGANGCVGKTTLTQNIEECTGIAKVGALSGVSVYPNPTSGVLTVEFNSNVAKSVSVQDLTGRVIMTANGTDSNITVDLSNLAAGVYYVKLQSEGSVSVVKVVKQ